MLLWKNVSLVLYFQRIRDAFCRITDFCGSPRMAWLSVVLPGLSWHQRRSITLSLPYDNTLRDHPSRSPVYPLRLFYPNNRILSLNRTFIREPKKDLKNLKNEVKYENAYLMINSPDTVYNIFQLVQILHRILGIVPTIFSTEVLNSLRRTLRERLDRRKAFWALKIEMFFWLRVWYITFKYIGFTFFIMFYGIVIIFFPFEFFCVLIMCCS